MHDDERLKRQLGEAVPRVPFPASGLERRIATTVHRRGRRRRALRMAGRGLVAAAALAAAFVAGLKTGHAPMNGQGGASVTGSSESIQQAGSAYVARLAEFSGAASRLTPDERESAREVALAILYAATVEVMHTLDDDDLLQAAARLIFSRRQAERGAGPEGVLWF